jgi:DNA repair protein RadD
MQPRYYQTEAENSIMNYFATHGKGNPLVCIPGGGGKSFIIASLIRNIIQNWPNQRILSLVHVKELISQNSNTLKRIWPSAPYGIYSAGLKQKEAAFPVVFGGVASVVKNMDAIGHRDLLLIDEAHLLSPKADTMYGQVIKKLIEVNPKLRIVGFTATPYRLGQGLLTNDGMFTDICFDITGMAAFNKLISEGFLSPLISKRTATQIDLSNVGISNGDFNLTELEATVDVNSLNYQVCKEMVEYGHERTSWLVFASGIKHSEHIAEMLRSFGIPTVAVHSKMGDENRDKALRDFRAGKLRCVVNNNVLTTGFDYPPIDFVPMLRPTVSTGLWVQMLSRATRPSPETMKRNALVLDFAGNTPRLGPINDPVIPTKRGQGTPGVPPIRICDQCGVYNHASARVCSECGYEFPVNVKLNTTAGTDDLIRSDMPQMEWFDVQRILYTKYQSEGKPPLLKVTYICGIRAFNEVVCLEYPGYPGKRARDWWKARMQVDEAPPSVDEALKWTSALCVPKRINVWVNRKYPEVVSTEY